MKKSLLVLVVALLTSLVSSAQVTDTIVSTVPSNRNVLIEEYTGIGCQYCPDGHRIANEIHDAYPDRVCVINIHQGGYANNTYTTAYGNALAAQIGLEGYPAGTVNRHLFSQYSNVLDVYRNAWGACANTIMSTPSPVNIAAEGTLDWNTRKLTLRVQLYYTGDQTVTSNMLNIAIIQDNVLGSQSGGSAFNPTQMVGNQYCHMHMLRHLITGQWGETIETIAPGTLVEKNYEYTIPEQLGSPNPINAVLKDLSFVAFVCEGHKEVLTCIEIPVQHLNVTGYNANIMSIKEIPNTNCSNRTNVCFNVKNISGETLNTLTYTCMLNGEPTTINWNGSIPSMGIGTVDAPELELITGSNNTLKLQITQINGHDVSSFPKTLKVKKNVYPGGGTMTFKLVTDRYASEVSFKIFDSQDNVLLSDGPWPDLSANGTTEREYTFTAATTDCYRIEVYDSYGDGINSGAGSGYFQLLDENGTQIFRDNGKFGSKATYMINVAYAGVEEYKDESVVYPNPATDVININASDVVKRVEIYNMQGQLVKVETGVVNSISVRDFTNGMYLLKLTTDKGTSMHKILKR